METAPLKKVGGRPPRLLKAIVRALLPYILREEVMANFDEDYNSLALPQFLRHISRTVWIMISMQVRQTINFEQAGAHACALYLAFAAAAISPRTLILVAVVLSVLILRSANRHPAEGSPQETALDTIIAVTFGFASQALIGLFAPSLTPVVGNHDAWSRDEPVSRLHIEHDAPAPRPAAGRLVGALAPGVKGDVGIEYPLVPRVFRARPHEHRSASGFRPEKQRPLRFCSGRSLVPCLSASAKRIAGNQTRRFPSASG